MEVKSSKLRVLRQSLADCEKRTTASDTPIVNLSPAGEMHRNALHEIYASDAGHCATATGFAASLAWRLSGKRPLFWITTDFTTQEYGEVTGSGLLELGIDPQNVFLLHLPRAEDVLHAVGDVLACPHVGAVVVELHGALKALDLNTSRRIALAAAARGVPAILLRFGVCPMASAAETRWLAGAAPSAPPPDETGWSKPACNAQLLRNRHGKLGQWHIEWNAEDGFFTNGGEQNHPPHSFALVPAPADRSAASQEAPHRATG